MAEPQSLVEVVSRFVPDLKRNGHEATSRCFWCSDGRPDSFKVGDTAWRTNCCGQQEVNGADGPGFLASWLQCSREDAEHKLSNGGLPEPMPVQVPPQRQAFFWTVKALLDNPSPIVWIHWTSDGVHFGREHLSEGRVHLGLCSGRPIDDESISLLDGRSCILIPDNRESSFERMNELAQKLYAAGHTKVRYVKVAGQEDCWAFPGQLSPTDALAFVQANVSTYPNNGAAQDYSQRPNRSDSSDEPPLAPPNASPSGPHTHAVSASGLEGGAPIDQGAARNDGVDTDISNGINDTRSARNATILATSTLNAAPTPAPAVASGHHPLVPPPIDTAGVGDAPNIAPDRSGSPPGVHPDDPGPVAPPGTPKARKSPPDLAVVDDTGAVRKPRLEITVDPDQLPAFSEFALARTFADGPGADWRFTSLWNLWAKWNGIRWVFDEVKHITWEVRECCTAVMHEHLADSTPPQRMRLATLKTVNAVMTLAGSSPRIAVSPDRWDADSMLLGSPSGIIDLSTGLIVTAERTQLISKSVCVSPQAGAHPWWDRVLARATGDVADFLQLWCGYILTGNTREERFLFIHGPGGGGKSKFLLVLSEILGDYRRTTKMESFTAQQRQEHSEEIARLAGARLVIATETDEGSRWNEARIKALTGRDAIAARHMHKSTFEFTPQFKLVFVGNHRPALRSVGEEMRRRIDLIEWGASIPEAERVLDLPDKLRAEYPAILAWMIEGCLRWQRQGLGKPESVKTSVADYIQGEDTLGSWLEECVDLTQGERTRTSFAYANFKRWTESRGEYVLSQKRFTQALKDRGFAIIKSMGFPHFIDMRLKASGPDDDYISESASWTPPER